MLFRLLRETGVFINSGVFLKLASLLGMLTILGGVWLVSADRGRISWKLVIWGLGLQIILALLVLRTPLGDGIFVAADRVTRTFLGVANEGAASVFSPLVEESRMEGVFGPGGSVVFAIRITATIIVVSSVSALFYYWGILQCVVGLMAWVMRRTMGTSGSESLATAANIIMGQTEAPLVVRPYLEGMTQSELMTLMTGGMATIAGSVLTIYVALGIDAGHLLTASIMSAPGTLVIAKILLPEMEASATARRASTAVQDTAQNAVDALCRGAGDGMKLAINVIAMLIAFVAVVALANRLLLAVQYPFDTAVTLEQILGWMHAPFAWLLGIQASDCLQVGRILGERIVLNEFVAFLDLSSAKEGLSPRSVTLTTYALCGFANFGSIAIQIGGIGALVPGRRADLARLGVRAMLAGLLSCYLTATLVGILI